MNYKKYQKDAQILIEFLRNCSNQTKVIHRDSNGISYTVKDLADQIENETPFGKETMSILGSQISEMIQEKEKFDRTPEDIPIIMIHSYDKNGSLAVKTAIKLDDHLWESNQSLSEIVNDKKIRLVKKS
jgi:hypothetical protein